MNCGSEWAGGDQRRHRYARSAQLVIENGSWARFAHGQMPLTSGSRSVEGRGASRFSRGWQTRADTKRPSSPDGKLDQRQILRLACVRSCSSSTAPTAIPVPAVSGRASGEQDSTRQPTSRCKSARLSLCVNQPSKEQNSTRQVRFGPETLPTSVLRRNRWLKPKTTVIRHGLAKGHHVLNVRFAEFVCREQHPDFDYKGRPRTSAR